MIIKGTLHSQSLEMDTGVTLLIPEHLREGHSYRVCYLLHPLGSGHDCWVHNTLLPLWSAEKEIIFVMPEGQRSFYVDMKHGLPYFTYIAQELPGMMQQMLRISVRREDTAIMGASMGGFAALRAAFLYPETFGFCGALAPACLFMKQFLSWQKDDPGVLRREFEACFGLELAWSPEYELTELALGARDRFPKLYLAVGTKDHLYRPAMRFANFLTENKLPCRVEQWKGEHDWEFFGPALQKAAQAFSET